MFSRNYLLYKVTNGNRQKILQYTIKSPMKIPSTNSDISIRTIKRKQLENKCYILGKKQKLKVKSRTLKSHVEIWDKTSMRETCKFWAVHVRA